MLHPYFIRCVAVNYWQKDDGKQLKFIPDLNRSYDPLPYPLNFPDGQE